MDGWGSYDGEIERGMAGHLLFLWGHADDGVPSHAAPSGERRTRQEDTAASADALRSRRRLQGGAAGKRGGGVEAPRQRRHCSALTTRFGFGRHEIYLPSSHLSCTWSDPETGERRWESVGDGIRIRPWYRIRIWTGSDIRKSSEYFFLKNKNILLK